MVGGLPRVSAGPAGRLMAIAVVRGYVRVLGTDRVAGGEQAEDTPPGGRQNRGGDGQDDQRSDQKRAVPDSQPPLGPGLGPGGPRHLTGEAGSTCVGAENSVTSCDLQILVYQAAEAVSS